MRAAVLLSAYNGEKYIRTQIDSILAQDCQIPFDLWVRDDGSSDGTTQILEQYAQEGKLRWYTGDNLRPAKSFLDLVKHCPGYGFYAFADQDDFWKPEKLSRGIARLQEAEGPCLYFSNARMVDGDLKDMGRDVYKTNPYKDYYTLVCQGGLLGCTMMFNSALAQLLQDAPSPDTLIMHDFYAVLVCDLFDGAVIYDSVATMLYRQHANNVVGMSRNKWQAVRSRLQTITNKQKVTVAEQAASVLVCYPQIPNLQKRQWLERVAGYREHFLRALALALSGKTHYTNKNKAITLRLALLLRNR